ncbi:MAG: CpsB/CapC family capsule biosynthesis tyrosine phosphatase [Luteimonas sp.]
MIDLHCHLLPGIDDGAVDLKMSLEMARMAAGDGIGTIVCTPHIYPGVYENNAIGIRTCVRELQAELDSHGIALRLLEGADVHLDVDLHGGIRAGRIPTLAGSRYLLLEPPHHVAPPRFEEEIFQILAAGIVPVITHPERLSWVESHFEMFKRLSGRGVWMQVTAGALTGRFGRRVQYWGERFVGEGYCMVLATDAHHPQRRPPLLAEAQYAAAALVGESEARHMVLTRPRGIIDDTQPAQLPPVLSDSQNSVPTRRLPASTLSTFDRIVRGLRRSA